VDIAVVGQAQHRRHAEAMAVDTDLATDPARNLLPEGLVLEAAGEIDRRE